MTARISPLVCALLLAACPSRPPAVPDDPSATPERVSFECEVRLDTGLEVTVNGAPTGLRLEPRTEGEQQESYEDNGPARGAAPQVFSVPLPPGQVLFTVVDVLSPDVDGILWRAPCDGSEPPRHYLPPEEVRVVTAAASPDKGTFYLTSRDRPGVWALEVATGALTQLTDPLPLAPGCWGFSDFGGPETYVDEILELEGRDLRFRRGAPCGYEADWNWQELRLVAVEDPSARFVRAPHPVASVAVDAEGTVWWGDAGRCDDIGGHYDPHTRGVVYRSSDWGDLPELVAIRNPEGYLIDNAVRLVLTDESGGGEILVLTGTCVNGGRGGWGGELYLTRDEGASWELVPPPPDTGYEGMGPLLTWAALPEGRLDHIVVCDERSSCWERGEADGVWTPAARPEVPPDYGRVATFYGLTFEATDDGLWLRDGANPPRLVFP